MIIRALISAIAMVGCALWTTPGQTQHAIVGCVEVPGGVLPTDGDTARRKSVRTRSTRAAAISAARAKSRINATNALAAFCLDHANTAPVPSNTCSAYGRFASPGSLQFPPVGRADRAAVDDQRGFDVNLVACAILRNLNSENTVVKVGNSYTATFFTRASCGVKCRPPP